MTDYKGYWISHNTRYEWHKVITFWVKDGKYHVSSVTMPPVKIEDLRLYIETLNQAWAAINSIATPDR